MAQEKVPAFLGGVPVGGAAGEVLEKTSNSDNVVGWATDDTGGGGGGSTTGLQHGGCFLQRVNNSNITLIPKGHGKLTIPGTNYPSTSVTLEVPSTFTNLTVSGLASDTIYLVFAYNNSGALALEVKSTAGSNEDYYPEIPYFIEPAYRNIAIRRYYADNNWHADPTRVLVGAIIGGSGGILQESSETQLNFRSYFNEPPLRLTRTFSSDLDITQSSSSTNITSLQMKALTLGSDLAYQNVALTAKQLTNTTSKIRFGALATRSSFNGFSLIPSYDMTTEAVPTTATSQLNERLYGTAGSDQVEFNAYAYTPDSPMRFVSGTHYVNIVNPRTFMTT